MLAAVLLSSPLASFAGDEKLLTPYPGSAEIKKETQAFAAFEIPLGPTKDGKLTKGLPLEGQVTELQYGNPPGRTSLEIYRNYEAALLKAGFKAQYACVGPSVRGATIAPCGDQIGRAGSLSYWPYDTTHYLAAKKVHDGKDVWAVVDVQGPWQKIWIVRPKAMETGKVTVNAEALKNDIESEGHVAVYGINFDSGRAEIKPGAEPILAEIAKLLKASPALNLYVVGHTDHEGGLDFNLGLSQKRAAAVVEALAAKHGVARARLSPQGVGPLVPLATNGTDAGRAKNRRVDLVKR
jgi:outer membrane protein OmpA-like peptidoglycan-associated protein